MRDKIASVVKTFVKFFSITFQNGSFILPFIWHQFCSHLGLKFNFSDLILQKNACGCSVFLGFVANSKCPIPQTATCISSFNWMSSNLPHYFLDCKFDTYGWLQMCANPWISEVSGDGWGVPLYKDFA